MDNLTAEQPTVTVAAAYSKNRKASILLLKSSTAKEVKRHLEGRMPTDLALSVPSRQHVAKMIRADLEHARRTWLEEFKDETERRKNEASDFLQYIDSDKRVADFHALRHTFITNLAIGGVHPKTAQTMARHSTFALTMERYSHSSRDSEVAALKVLPEFTVEKPVGEGEFCLAVLLAGKGSIWQDFGRLWWTPTNAEGRHASAGQRGKYSEFSSGEGEIRTPARLP